MDQKLTKKERKEQRKQEQQEAFHKELVNQQKKKWAIIGGVVVFTVALFGLLIWKLSEPAKPQPGQAVAELSRDHISDIGGVTYNSNPPTSGPHFEAWAKRGAYPYALSDGYLLHSLEHGYIVLSYNCGLKASKVDTLTYKKGDLLTTTSIDPKSPMVSFTPESAPKQVSTLPQEFSSASCKQLITNLSKFLDQYQRIVIVPRTNLDTPIAVTAWGHIEKMNSFDEKKLRDFIEAFHNAGPEKTME